jgi:hypothetical protein
MKFALLGLLISICFSVNAQNGWTPLLDTDLSNWDTYISFKHKDGYDGSPPKDALGNLIEPIGLNTQNEQLNVFSTTEIDDEVVVRVSGEYYGALTTKETYQNYRLKLKFRWGELKWEPRLHKLKDSGILYHAIGEHGKEHFRSWMISQEFQIMQGHIGDYWNQVTTAIDIKAYLPEYIMNPVADENQPFLPVGKGEKTKGFVLRKDNHENPHGQWNELELVTFNGKSLHIVNGHVVMVLQNSRNVIDGVSKPLIAGKIQLQSEAAELFYKDIYIKKIEALPPEFVRFFEPIK